MELSQIIPHIEALIFASEKPLNTTELTELVNNALGFIEDRANMEQVETAIEGIQEKYAAEFYAFELKQSGGGWQFLTKKEYHKTVALLNGDRFLKRLSTAAIETLAIIAYKQPITRVEIEEIRGVNCEMMLKKLVARGLIEAKDRLDAIGKPLLYRVTDEFLDAFQLEDLKELPELPQTRNNSEELFEGE